MSAKVAYDKDEWCTPEYVVEPIRAILGSIDLDPCSNARANEVIKAARYYTKENDSLTKLWSAETVFLNPPYSNPRPFIARFLEAFYSRAFHSGIVLTNNATDTQWFQALAISCSAIHFPPRIQFYHPERGSISNRNGQAIFFFSKAWVAEFERIMVSNLGGFTVEVRK